MGSLVLVTLCVLTPGLEFTGSSLSPRLLHIKGTGCLPPPYLFLPISNKESNFISFFHLYNKQVTTSFGRSCCLECTPRHFQDHAMAEVFDPCGQIWKVLPQLLAQYYWWGLYPDIPPFVPIEYYCNHVVVLGWAGIPGFVKIAMVGRLLENIKILLTIRRSSLASHHPLMQTPLTSILSAERHTGNRVLTITRSSFVGTLSGKAWYLTAIFAWTISASSHFRYFSGGQRSSMDSLVIS